MSVAVIFLTACGGGGGGEVPINDTTTETNSSTTIDYTTPTNDTTIETNSSTTKDYTTPTNDTTTETNSSTPTSDTTTETNNSTPTNDTTTTNELLSFNFSNAKAIFAHKNTFNLNEATSTATSLTPSGKFMKRSAKVVGEGDTSTISNILVVDENGTSQAGLSSNNPIKVLYTVTSPNADKVYVVLDINYYGEDGLDYRRAIIANSCALYEVTVKDNSYKCVKEGLSLKAISDTYYQQTSSNKKPIQFDKDGNLYFMATTFEVTNNSINHDYTELLYKYNPETNITKNISQDNEYIQYFSVLPNGEVAFQSYTNNGENALYLLQGDSKIDIQSGWYIDFFTTDSYDTLILGNGDNGINFARSLKTGGVQKTTLNTSKFGGTPQRVIIADDGHIYGVFQEYNYNNTTNKTEYQAVVYQMLPYSPTPKARIDLGSDGYYSYSGTTPLQISKGYLYYSEKKDILFDGASYGTAHNINMVNLNTLEKTTLLSPQTADDNRIELYNWRLSNGKLYFSGLEKKSNVVITGLINTFDIGQGVDTNESISITEAFSATKVDLAINDIEIITPVKPEQDTGANPQMVNSDLDASNPYSLSLEFNKYMNYESVLDNTILSDSNGQKVNFMPIWVNKSLHLIPDLDAIGNDTTVPLSEGETYTLTLGDKIYDAWDWEFANATYTMTMDLTPPTLTLISKDNYYENYGTYGYVERIDVGSIYNERGATATDNIDGNLTSQIVITGSIDTSIVGVYTLTYTVRDNAGNIVTQKREVEVANLPDISFVDDTPLLVALGSSEFKPMVNAYDDVDGNISDKVVCGASDYYVSDGSIYFYSGISGGMGVFENSDSYTFSCVVINSKGYVNSVSKSITVVEGAIFDGLSYWSSLTKQYVDIGTQFVPKTVSVTDTTDDNISQREVIVTGDVDTSVEGIYTITYSVTNIHGVTSTKTREVEVANLPEITLIGDSNITIAPYSYIELGATAYDNTDGNITSSVACGIMGYYEIYGTSISFFGEDMLYSELQYNMMDNPHIGTHIVTCVVVNSQGKVNEVERIVNVVDIP